MLLASRCESNRTVARAVRSAEARVTARAVVLADQRLLAEVVHDSGSWSWLEDSGGAVASVASALAGATNMPARICTVSVVLGTDALVRDLNRDWRQQDKPTNVLSFPSPAPPVDTPGELFIGDVVLAEETILREASEQAISPCDHFFHLVLHGLLHLLGFDHETPAEADSMEALETRVLAGLGVADPYAGTEQLSE
jgi:probable rRNA maturation factor